jgi:hypothetical protein
VADGGKPRSPVGVGPDGGLPATREHPLRTMSDESPYDRLPAEVEAYGPRARRLLERIARERVRRGPERGRPAECPLRLPFGHREPCLGSACIYYQVPGVRPACAVQAWAPRVRAQPELASWFLARRTDAAAAARPGDPALAATHALPTPGPGDDSGTST